MFWLRLGQALRILRVVALVVAPFVIVSWLLVALGVTEYLA